MNKFGNLLMLIVAILNVAVWAFNGIRASFYANDFCLVMFGILTIISIVWARWSYKALKDE